MYNIITQVTPNNQIKIKSVNRPASICRENKGDSPLQARENRASIALEEVRRMRNILSLNSKQEINFYDSVIASQLTFEGKDVIETKKESFLSCSLPSVIKYYDNFDGTYLPVKQSYQDFNQELRRHLDIIKKSQHLPKKHCNWGKEQTTKYFGTNAKQKILQSGAIIDREFDREKTFEVTCTIPGSTKEAMQAVSRYSGWIVNRQLQVLRRYSKKPGNLVFFFVWEFQKRGALHQHWCISGKLSAEEIRSVCGKLKDMWFRCLSEIEEKEGIDCFERRGFQGTWKNDSQKWQWNIASIKKSVAAYFSKYCSKNAKKSSWVKKRILGQVKEGKTLNKAKKEMQQKLYYPSRFWGSSQYLKQRIKEKTITFTFKNVTKDSEELMFGAFWLKIASSFTVVKRYENSYEIYDEKTNFIYAQVKELTAYIKPEEFDDFEYCMDALAHCMDAKHCMDAMLINWLD